MSPPRVHGQRCDPIVALFICIGLVMCVRLAWTQSVTIDEASHVPAGLAYWQHTAFHVYSHNPPFAKLSFSAFWHVFGIIIPNEFIWSVSSVRQEHTLSRLIYGEISDDLRFLFFTSRCVSIFSYGVAAITIAKWSSSIYGMPGSRVSTALWCLHPTVIGHASLATPDVPAAALGIVACYCCMVFVERGRLVALLLSSVSLGLAVSTKYSQLYLYAVLVALGAFYLVTRWKHCVNNRATICGVVLSYLASIVVIWLTYGFNGLFVAPDSMKMYSSVSKLTKEGGAVGQIIAHILPVDYLEGIDRQWLDTERGYPNCYGGVTRRHVDLSYYPVAFVSKTPLCFLVTLIVALITFPWYGILHRVDGVFLVICPIAFVGLHFASASPAYLRYLIPAFAFAAVAVGCVGIWLTARCYVWLAMSLLLVAEIYACSAYDLGYFNILFERSAPAWFSDSEVDWGQDVGKLIVWREVHAGSQRVVAAIFSPYFPYDVNRKFVVRRYQANKLSWSGVLDSACYVPSEPEEGYFAISRSLLNRMSSVVEPGSLREFGVGDSEVFCRWLTTQCAVARVGNSIEVYYFSGASIEDWRKWRVNHLDRRKVS